MNADERRLNEITEKIIGCAYAVANGMASEFFENGYENAMDVEISGLNPATPPHPAAPPITAAISAFSKPARA